ncbi:hypothetical protein CGCVW01_v010132 [Colletotrichum viniferum]|nr:hypothetical protein CGCVW01_v010132 [Colletotrichum viniferum]
MDDLKQLDPTLPHHRDNQIPPIPDKKPIEADSASIPLEGIKPTYSSALKNPPSVNAEPPSPSLSSESDAMGFTKVEMPATVLENGGQSKGPRQALPKGLVATRFANVNVAPPQRALSPPSTTTSASFLECEDLINFETDNSQSTRDTSSQDSVLQAQCDENTPVSALELRLHRDIDDLRQKLRSSKAQAEIAEERADRMEKRIQEIKSVKAPKLTDAERDINSLYSSVNELKTENSALKEQLRDAQSHIFSLQPYRKELTPEEVGRQYDDLVEGITDWVAKFMAPLLDNHAKGVDELLTNSRKRPTEAHKLKHAIQTHADLVHGTMFPETDEDVIISIIMRFLNDSIFQKILYGSCASFVESLSFIEMALQNTVEPKRDLFAIRTWTAEAYNAIVSSREFRGVREKRMREMTIELAGIFKILCKKDQLDIFYKNFEENCVRPAMQLYEKIQISTHHFYFDINPYILWGSEGEFQTSTDFLDNVSDLDCKNILQNRKAFSMSKMDPPPSKKELYHRLLNVCTITPALYMRQIGRKDSIREPQIVRRQQMLVAWGLQDKKEAFIRDGDQTLLNHLYTARNEREKAEAGGWATFRWPG